MGQFKLMVLRERQRLENAFNENLFLSPYFLLVQMSLL